MSKCQCTWDTYSTLKVKNDFQHIHGLKVDEKSTLPKGLKYFLAEDLTNQILGNFW